MQSMGRFVLVVGPSGAGKDTLIAAAKQHFSNDARYSFPQRLVTRNVDRTLEDHAVISRDAFERMRAEGDYTLCWEAHGLGYIIPANVREDVGAGRVVVCNVSRRSVAAALAVLSPVNVVVVTASAEIRAERLAARGRESLADIERRLKREGAPIPKDVAAQVIDNSGGLDDAVRRFCRLLEAGSTGPQTREGPASRAHTAR